MTIGEKIAKIRKDAGLSQEVFGESLGVSRQAISKWESDASIPEVEKLISISKEYSVDIGWILGTKAEPEDTPELTSQQLQMVNEIAAKYIAALEDKAARQSEDDAPREGAESASPRRRGRRFLKFIALAAVIIWGIYITNYVQSLSNAQNSIQNSLQNIRYSVDNSINSIAYRVEEVLKSQNTLFARYSAQVTGADFGKDEIYISSSIVPKTYVSGTEVYFIGDSGGSKVRVKAAQDGDRNFTASLACPISDSIIIYGEIHSGGKVETQIIQELGGFEYEAAPDVSCDISPLWGDTPENISREDFTMYLNFHCNDRNHEFYGQPLTAEKIDLFILQNEKIAFKESFYIEDNTDDAVYDFLPNLTVKNGDEIVTLAVVIDNYGRRHIGTADIAEIADGSAEPADFKYDGTELLNLIYAISG